MSSSQNSWSGIIALILTWPDSQQKIWASTGEYSRRSDPWILEAWSNFYNSIVHTNFICNNKWFWSSHIFIKNNQVLSLVWSKWWWIWSGPSDGGVWFYWIDGGSGLVQLIIVSLAWFNSRWVRSGPTDGGSGLVSQENKQLDNCEP